MTVSVEDTDPVRAAQIANSIGTVFAEQNQAFQASRYTDSKESLSVQLAQVDQQLKDTQAALAEIRSRATIDPETGKEVLSLDDQNERDRLEANLALYQQLYTNLLQSYETVRLAEIQNTSNVVLVEPAVPPLRPVRPNVWQDTSLAAVIGLMLAGGVVFLIEALDDTVKGPDEVARLLGLPVLGLIAQLEESEDGPITFTHPRSPIAEAFRSLRTNIQYASVDYPLRTLLVTSPSPQDGKSTIAANLAVVLAQSGRKVVLLDADLRRPSLHRRLQLSNRRGLTDLFVQSQVFLDGAVRKTKIPGLSLLSSGGLPPNPSELIGSEKMGEVLHRVKEQADVVVLDSPPVMVVTDAAVLAPRVDAVLLVIRPGVTRLAPTRHTVEQLRLGGANILGVVLNDVENKRSRYYYYYKGYYTYNSYYYGEPAKVRKNRRRKPQREG
jgi:non-specific protein-tyrosine kinase